MRESRIPACGIATVEFRVSAGRNLRFSSGFWRAASARRPIAFSLKLNSRPARGLHFRRVNLSLAAFSAITYRIASEFYEPLFPPRLRACGKIEETLRVGDLCNLCVIEFTRVTLGIASRVEKVTRECELHAASRNSAKSSKIESL